MVVFSTLSARITPKDHDEVMELIHYVDDVNVAHGATTNYFSTTTPEAQALAKKLYFSE